MRLFSDDNLAVANIWAEARGEIFDGKVAVAEVMRNRMKRHYASDGTVASTVFWAWQFSGFNTDNHWRARIFELDNVDAVVRECYDAWIKSEATDLTHGAVLYCNIELLRRSNKIPRWAKDENKTATIGQHTFFSDEKRRLVVVL